MDPPLGGGDVDLAQAHRLQRHLAGARKGGEEAVDVVERFQRGGAARVEILNGVCEVAAPLAGGPGDGGRSCELVRAPRTKFWPALTASKGAFPNIFEDREETTDCLKSVFTGLAHGSAAARCQR